MTNPKKKNEGKKEMKNDKLSGFKNFIGNVFKYL